MSDSTDPLYSNTPELLDRILTLEEISRITERYNLAKDLIKHAEPGNPKAGDAITAVLRSAPDVGLLLLDAARSRGAISQSLGYLSDTLEEFRHKTDEEVTVLDVTVLCSTLVALMRYETGLRPEGS